MMARGFGQLTGTVFAVLLPNPTRAGLPLPTASGVCQCTRKSLKTAAAAGHHGVQILLIEDEDEIASFIAQICKETHRGTRATATRHVSSANRHVGYGAARWWLPGVDGLTVQLAGKRGSARPPLSDGATPSPIGCAAWTVGRTTAL